MGVHLVKTQPGFRESLQELCLGLLEPAMRVLYESERECVCVCEGWKHHSLAGLVELERRGPGQGHERSVLVCDWVELKRVVGERLCRGGCWRLLLRGLL